MAGDGNPYIGPRPFEPEDAPLFFGRDREIQNLTSLIVAHRAVLVYAESGAGKSSLINAGIIPRLRARGFVVWNPARVQGLLPSNALTEQIDNIFMFHALHGWLKETVDWGVIARLSLRSFLEQRQESEHETRSEALLVIIFDQFEELFTFYQERWSDRRRFFEQVGDALEPEGEDRSVVRPGSPLRVVFVIRDDFMAKLDPYAGLLPDRLRVRFCLERLRRDAALAAIEKPVHGTGRRFAPGVAETFVDELLKARVQTERGRVTEVPGEFVEPVQLQVVGRDLWQNLPPQVRIIGRAHLGEAINVRDALGRFYTMAVSAAVRQLGVDEGRLRSWFEKKLITEAGTRGIAFKGERLTEGIPNEVVEIFERHHVLRSQWRAGGQWIELSHDRFVDAIEAFNRQWLEQKATDYQEKAADAQALVAVERSERKHAEAEAEAQRRLRLITLTQAIAARAPREQALRRDERGLLLARQAYRLAKRTGGYGLDQADTALREVLGTPFFGHILQAPHQVAGVAFSPDGLTVASACYDATVQLWSVRDPRPPIVLSGHENGVFTVAFSPDGRLVASGGHDRTVRLWDLAAVGSDRSCILSRHENSIVSVTFSPDGRLLASGGWDQKVRIWDLHQHNAQPTILEHDGWVWSIAFAPDGRTLASGTRSGRVQLWPLESRSSRLEPEVIGADLGEVFSVAFAPNGATLAAGSAGGLIRLWPLGERRKIPVTLRGHMDNVRALAFASNGRLLVSGSDDQTIRLWDVEHLHAGPTYPTASATQVLHGHHMGVSGVALSPDDQTLASGSWDWTIRLWRLSKPFLTPRVMCHSRAVRSVAFGPDGGELIFAADDAKLHLWSLRHPDPTALRTFEGHVGPVFAVAFSPDGRLVASGGEDGTVRLWDPRQAAMLFVLLGHTAAVRAVAFNPDGVLLASGGNDGSIRLWDIRQGMMARVLLRGSVAITSLAFGPPEGRLLAASGEDRTVRLWALEQLTATQVVLPAGHSEAVTALAFGPDGRLLASGSYDRTVRVWDLRHPGSAPTVLRGGHDRGIHAVAFSPDGDTIASGGNDWRVCLWSISRPELGPITLPNPSGGVSSVAFSSDGVNLASGSYNGTLIIQIARTEILADMVCDTAWRNLTPEEWDKFLGADITYEPTCPSLPPSEQPYRG